MSTTFFKINNQDFSGLVSNFKIGYEVLVSEDSGRNAKGNTILDVINRKRKIYVTLRPTTNAEMQQFLDAVKPYVVTVQYLDARTGTIQSAKTYIGTPEPEYYFINDRTVFKPLSLNFIEL